ncbi:MAG: phosphosulfolactate synthase [Thermaerobacter sp.]|nr:phosphosulfolactate synthase [Thermaerobacter sp.]
MTAAATKAWGDILEFPQADRTQKVRDRGLTMVIDKGVGLTDTRDLLELAADYVDQWKLTFGTSAFYSTRLLRQKIELIKSYGVRVFPGGTFLEVALLQGRLVQFLDRARDLGFTGIEISDGTINLDGKTRCNTIKLARAYGFELVVSEVGKKDPRDKASGVCLWEQVNQDLDAGSDVVIVEGRESGEGVVIYDDRGNVLEEELETLVEHVREPSRVLWEAPKKSQQQELIVRFGPNVNLGNIEPHDVLALEALRVGLRGDTLRQYYLSLAQWLQPVTVPSRRAVHQMPGTATDRETNRSARPTDRTGGDPIDAVD